MGKAAIVNPYLDTLGGGERYTISFAKILLDMGWQVDLEWNDKNIKNDLENRFGIDLSGLNVISDVKRGDGYDLCFWVSDGSIPLLRSRNNILHFQVPFHGVNGKSLLNKMKLIRINKIVCNSEFTKKVIDEEYGVDGLVIYPPISVNDIKIKRKENMILYVGRFSQLKQNKRQDILIESFKKIVGSGLSGWKLVLAGGTEVGVGSYLNDLRKLSENYPVEIVDSPNFIDLLDYYGRSKIFWSAAGFNEDEIKSPEKMEHFGMTVVEAMAGGAIPIIFNGGGHKEIIKNGVNGFLWNDQSELIEKTKSILSNRTLFKQIAFEAHRSSLKYDIDSFKKEFSDKIIKSSI